MEHLCPRCAALRLEWLDAIEKWSAVTRSSDDTEGAEAARLDEHRAFCKYIEGHHACEECRHMKHDEGASFTGENR